MTATVQSSRRSTYSSGLDFSKGQARYSSFYRDGNCEEIKRRKQQANVMVDQFYDLVTEFYEYGWGESFHFAPRHVNESLDASLLRHEHYMALRLGLKEGTRVLDLGCGVGGPLRNIAHFTGAHITGITINQSQVEKANVMIDKEGLSETCSVIQGDFTLDILSQVREAQGDHLKPFDVAFSIESICHAGDKLQCLKHVYDSLKPGAYFAACEWTTTPRYNPEDPKHFNCVRRIEQGDALPELSTQQEVLDAFRKAGFEVIESKDLALSSHVGWETPLSGRDGWMSAFRASKVGRRVTHLFCVVAEAASLAPRGIVNVHEMLCSAADAVVEGAQLGIFTPMFFTLARKPE
eukprot:TRINITY_DN2890_c3_g1::TRINITY_DN2890_c3_g1_i1::g.5819::m.5819 TRINITY_DN2890_c3_g1::TRINITY_DN2890_c3_g1_i1::g.5819  ORF type:complete len:371 (-),score=42.58,sp/Q54I98/SMT1_DICDI/41.80/3e-86,Sterol_MT_C/PF08498.5/1.3e-20,Methyltransf_31/PF13847.1/1.1e-15,Methyltransf_23/PF13489.1/1.9e-15,CMAS/PF02353.15/3.7e-13,Methyltransf_11/PF08241.7/4.2e+03,Methyltransf_11/PF08241.7/2.2e-10,Methyltransf_18/PF12847.2/7.9e+03,Methyltransf_18/PF12847.2/3.4e-10,Methyltransf_12/PF08242.7/5.9e+03,Methyltransf_12/